MVAAAEISELVKEFLYTAKGGGGQNRRGGGCSAHQLQEPRRGLLKR